jgi:hypothetical protein
MHSARNRYVWLGWFNLKCCRDTRLRIAYYENEYSNEIPLTALTINYCIIDKIKNRYTLLKSSAQEREGKPKNGIEWTVCTKAGYDGLERSEDNMLMLPSRDCYHP